MDIVLRGQMDGIEAAQKIYERFGIPSIFMTGYSEELLERLNVLEPLLYVSKPVDINELITAIDKVLTKA